MTSLTDLARQVVAARVLLPGDMGLMGIVLLQLSVLEALTKTGFDQALIQRDKGVGGLMNVAWTWQVLRGLVLAAVLAAAAPLLARGYDLPVLAPLIWVTCLHVVLQGLQNVGLIYFSRDLDFKALFFINAVRTTVQAGVAIPAIIIRQDVWALVIGLVAGTLASVIVSFVAHPLRPKLEWDLAKARQLLKFGKWITGLTIMVFLIVQGDALFVSWYLGPVALGLYMFAYDLAALPTTKLTYVIGRVAFPAYSRLQAKPDEMRAVFLDVMRATMLVSGPVSVLLFAIIPDIVHHVVGGKWEPVIPLVRILVIAGWVRSFAALAGPLFQGANRPDLDFKMNLPRFLIAVLLIWPACAYGGLKGASYIVLAGIVTCLPTWFYGVKLLVGISPWQVLKSNVLAWVTTAVLGVTYLVSRHLLRGDWVRDIASSLVAIIAWLVVMAVVGWLTPLSLLQEIRRLRGALATR
ncbi:MAG: lipopolysaccharide biosynthesis protein [Polyangiaceae bacterium]|nr:lipopolysaccharide biosynthesis protein [Polyangiaceae bacterium]